MGLVELLLSMAAVVVVLGGVVLVSESLRADTSELQTRTTLGQLRLALKRYHARHGHWPPGLTDTAVLCALLADPVTAPIVQPLPLCRDRQGMIRVHDGYDQPIRYVVDATSGAMAVDFVSAGADGRFGDLTFNHPGVHRDAMDNLYGSDLETPRP